MSSSVGSDLTTSFPSELELHLQSAKIFDELHEASEKSNYLFGLGHRAIKLVAEPSVDNEWLMAALLRGVETYEIIASTLNARTYCRPDETSFVHNSILEFVGDINAPSDFFAKAELAQMHLEKDVPLLAETVREISSRYVNHDKVAETFALRGAAILRAVHIYTDRSIPNT